MSDRKSAPDGPMVLPRAFDLLDALAAGRSSLTLTEAAQVLDVPRSSLSSILKTMTEMGLLSRSGNAYAIGPRAFELSSKIQTGRSIRHIARPYMAKAQEETGETLILAELDQDRKHVLYIDTIESEKSVRFYVPIASRRPLYASATGRVFLAHFTSEERSDYFESTTIEKLSEFTVTDESELHKIFEDIREQGISVTIGQLSEDAAGFAAPVFDETGSVRAAIAVGVPTPRAEKNGETYKAAALRAAASVSRNLGYMT